MYSGAVGIHEGIGVKVSGGTHSICLFVFSVARKGALSFYVSLMFVVGSAS